MFRKILIANDGSAGAATALTAAITLAKQSKAELHMICVEELPQFPTSIEEVIEEKQEANHVFSDVIARAQAEAKAHHLKLTAHVVAGHAVARIVEAIAEQRFDLLVVGFMGHAALYNRMVGGTTDRLVEMAPCSVLVVK
jgi:nucleotide-binding universal stress UspA family protein